ncbi:MAG TPA: MFS transporter [Tepidisphaeraceae bacterium]|jgi:MFS family permease|nr:MFS transporter [Tepidisphaeraceae bacterium]
MSIRSAGLAAITTLVLSTLLHAFTHAFGAMLVPLYLLIWHDLKLPGVKSATLIVTVYGMVYAILSYPAGVMADRISRKTMLGAGLLLNAIVIVLMGLTRHYEMLLVLAVFAGIAGTVFHPAANALVPEHFPKSPGMAIGLLGIGSGLGFFAGPQYAGWRAESARWHWHAIADWQRPCIELGLAGVVVGVLFLLLASEARPAAAAAARRNAVHPPLGRALRSRLIAIAVVLGFRDFAGVASLTLASIYLQRALKFDAKGAGLIIGVMMLMGVLANPIAVWLSPGARRLPGLAIVLVLAGLAVAATPFFTTRVSVLVVLCAFQALQLGSYAMSDAAMLERVPANVRGRVVGLFLTIAGTFAGTSPWLMGYWTDAMGAGAQRSISYFAPFATLGGMMIFAALSTPIIAKLGMADENAINPLSEIVPSMMEPAV